MFVFFAQALLTEVEMNEAEKIDEGDEAADIAFDVSAGIFTPSLGGVCACVVRFCVSLRKAILRVDLVTARFNFRAPRRTEVQNYKPSRSVGTSTKMLTLTDSSALSFTSVFAAPMLFAVASLPRLEILGNNPDQRGSCHFRHRSLSIV